MQSNLLFVILSLVFVMGLPLFAQAIGKFVQNFDSAKDTRVSKRGAKLT